MIYSTLKLVTPSALIAIYHSLVMPVETNNIIIWTRIFLVHVGPISVEFNKTLRLISPVRFRERKVFSVISCNNSYINT